MKIYILIHIGLTHSCDSGGYHVRELANENPRNKKYKQCWPMQSK